MSSLYVCSSVQQEPDYHCITPADCQEKWSEPILKRRIYEKQDVDNYVIQIISMFIGGKNPKFKGTIEDIRNKKYCHFMLYYHMANTMRMRKLLEKQNLQNTLKIYYFA